MKQIATAIGVLVIAATLFFGTSFLISYAVIDIVRLFDIPYLKTFSFFNIFGVIIVISMIRMKTEHKKSEGENDDKMIQAISKTISGILSILMLWGLCYIVKYLFM